MGSIPGWALDKVGKVALEIIWGAVGPRRVQAVLEWRKGPKRVPVGRACPFWIMHYLRSQLPASNWKLTMM